MILRFFVYKWKNNWRLIIEDLIDETVKKYEFPVKELSIMIFRNSIINIFMENFVDYQIDKWERLFRHLDSRCNEDSDEFQNYRPYMKNFDTCNILFGHLDSRCSESPW